MVIETTCQFRSLSAYAAVCLVMRPGMVTVCRTAGPVDPERRPMKAMVVFTGGFRSYVVVRFQVAPRYKWGAPAPVSTTL